MPTAKPLDLDMHQFARNLTITVRPRNLWRLRLGLWLIAIGARLAGCRLDVRRDWGSGR